MAENAPKKCEKKAKKLAAICEKLGEKVEGCDVWMNAMAAKCTAASACKLAHKAKEAEC